MLDFFFFLGPLGEEWKHIDLFDFLHMEFDLEGRPFILLLNYYISLKGGGVGSK